jgi:hypothetical protein
MGQNWNQIIEDIRGFRGIKDNIKQKAVPVRY